MKRFLSALAKNAQSRFTAPLAPDRPFIAVGDIHGRMDLLQKLLRQIALKAPALPIVCLGDYIDRGPESASVLKALFNLSHGTVPELVCLMGNHEAMLLDFLDDPCGTSALWLRNGGAATLDSFGIEGITDQSSDTALIAAAEALTDALGPGRLAWLRALPLMWQSGNVVAAHAGGDPTRPFDARRGHGLLWGHPSFLRQTRTDGLWVVHGHFITDTPQIGAGRVSIDTGAWRSGTLTAAVVDGPEVWFISV